MTSWVWSTSMSQVLDTSDLSSLPKSRRRWLISGRFKGVQVDEILPLATLIQRCMTSAPRGIFNLSFNSDKSSAASRPYRGTRYLFANVHRALMNHDETRRGAPGSKRMDSSLFSSPSIPLSSLSLFFSPRSLRYFLRD